MTKPSLRIALYQPDIAGNTGTIIRMAACLGLAVDIIEPAGFDTSDRNLRRAGMDYLELATVQRHADFVAFDDWRTGEGRRLVLLSTKAETSYTAFDYRGNDILLFGRESAGVPDHVHETADARVTIKQAAGRSLNLAVSAAMAAGEAVRQVGFSKAQEGGGLHAELDARLWSALATDVLPDVTREILLAYKAAGFSSDQVYGLLNARLEKADGEDDRLRDIMDIVSGFCPLSMRVWN